MRSPPTSRGSTGPETRTTHTQYRSTLRRLAARFGPGADVAGISVAALRAWAEETWGQRKPATFNRAVDVMRSAFGYWTAEGWCTEDPSQALRRRRVAPDRSRALSRAQVEALLTREDLPLRERVLWRMLYETAARAAEVLALDVEDLDLTNRRAKVRRKGGAVDVIVWQTGTARLLPRLIKGRKSGPLFLTARRGAVSTTPSGYERLSYRRCRRAVHRGHRRRARRAVDAAPAPAQRAHPRRRAGRVDAVAHGAVRPHLHTIAGQVRPGLRRGAAALAAGTRPSEAALSTAGALLRPGGTCGRLAGRVNDDLGGSYVLVRSGLAARRSCRSPRPIKPAQRPGRSMAIFP